MDTDNISKLISGKCISYIEAHKDRELAIVFVDGSALLVKRLGQGLSMDFVSQQGRRDCREALRPTIRQREYLEFIKKYMMW